MSGNRFIKGRTNNHLTWLMCDATDFATPESALSAATKIKIYGKLRGATGVNFVSSGTGSLTNDIQHVGASVLGIYTIALAKADLSDASAAWYDHYVVSLSATGAAYQTIIVDGGIDESTMLVLSDAVSNAYSAALQANSRVLLVQSRLSDLDSRLVSDLSDILSQVLLSTSAASDAASAAAQANSRVLLVQSRLSDFDSRMVSDVSDVLSAVAVGNSRVLLCQSRISDVQSYLVAMSDSLSDCQSDLASKIAGITATLGASDISDIASAVQIILSDTLSNILSAAVQGASRTLLVQSRLSDFDSRLVSDVSDLMSQVLLATSAASDAASAAAQANSRVLLVQSRLSDFDSRMVSDISDVLSAVAVGNSRTLLCQSRISDVQSYLVAMSDSLSDAQSDLASRIGGITATLGASDISDIASAVQIILSDTLSNILSAAVQGASRALINQSRISDVQSYLVAMSDSISDAHSDLASKIGAITVSISASDVSDIASAVVAALPITSAVSDIYSLLSDFNSNFNSRVPKEPAARSQLSDLSSDLLSYLVGISGVTSDAHSAAAAANTNAAAAASRVLLVQSRLSDLDSRLVSDLSDILSQVLLSTSAASDAASAAAQASSRILLVQSRLSDLDSRLTSDVSDVLSAVAVGNSRALLNQSRISDVQSYLVAMSDSLSDAHSDLASKIAAGVSLDASTLSDLRSAIAATELDASDLSDIASAVHASISDALSNTYSAAAQGASRALLNQSRISDVYSLLSDVHSDLRSYAVGLSGTLSDLQSALSDAHSDLASRIANVTVVLDSSNISDIASAVVAGLPPTGLTAQQVWEYASRTLTDDFTSGQQAILVSAANAILSSGTVIVPTLFAPGVGGTFSLVRGDDYYDAEGRALEWSSDTTLDLSTAAIRLYAHVNSSHESDLLTTASWPATATVTGTSGAWTIKAELTTAKTESLIARRHALSLIATLTGGHVLTLNQDVAQMSG